MGTTSSQNAPTEGTLDQPVAEHVQPQSSEVSSGPPDAAHPRDHHNSKEAFARVAAANDSEKSSVLSSELASAEALAEVNLAQFFEALESRCETDEEREALKGLIDHRKEEQERWRLARTGADPNAMPFPTGNYDPPEVPANSLEWWVGLPSAGGARDVNETVFPLRHFEAKGDATSATQEEVPTSAESLREDLIATGSGGWVNDELSDGEVVHNKDLAWKLTPPMEGMTENEVKFLNGFWERRGLAEESKPEIDFTTNVEPAGAWAPTEPLKDVIANDVTTPDQEAVIQLRQTRGQLTESIRNRRVNLLAQHFAEREQKKMEAKKSKGDQVLNKAVEEEVPVPSAAFFEERLEVATEETTKAQKANRLAQEEAVIDKLAEEGSKYTSFASPTKSGETKEGEGFPFTSPEAKNRVDKIIAKREKERAENAQPARTAPKPPSADVPPPPPTSSEDSQNN